MKKIIVAITGASGAIIGIRLLEALTAHGVHTHLILSEGAKTTIALETDYSVAQVERMATACYDNSALSSPLASGSFLTDGMVIVPCSMKTLSAVANSYDETLIARAAGCMLKERRRLVLMPRETPLHTGQLELMHRVSLYGGVILPPVPAFYHHPQSIGDLLDHLAGKAMDLLGVEHHLFQRWNGAEKPHDNLTI